jgi:hypothetical protein
MIYEVGSRCPATEVDIAGLSWDQFFEAVESAMKKIPNSHNRAR